ncbi:MAG: Mth938-like domain-containing protein [Pseudomonadota bacterium]
MQFNLERDSNLKLIDTYFDAGVKIDGQAYHSSLILFPDKLIENWPVQSVDDITAAHIEVIIEAAPEVFLLGTGARQVFPPMRLMESLARAGRSIDVMDTGAACRTYNVLASELRQVAVALIIDDQRSQSDQA